MSQACLAIAHLNPRGTSLKPGWQITTHAGISFAAMAGTTFTTFNTGVIHDVMEVARNTGIGHRRDWHRSSLSINRRRGTRDSRAAGCTRSAWNHRTGDDGEWSANPDASYRRGNRRTATPGGSGTCRAGRPAL